MVNVKNDLLHNMMIVFRFSHVSNMSDAQKTEVCFPGITHITVEISRFQDHPDRYSNLFLNAYINRHMHAIYLQMI